MDLRDASQQRFELEVERFLDGHTLAFEGIVLEQDRSGELIVYSYSAYIHAGNATPAEALDKIERSKQVLAALCERSPAIAAFVSARPRRYLFCHDYKSAAIPLAEESDQGFVWRGLR